MPKSDCAAPAAWTARLQPVFLVGAARSGTTWLQAMLSEHSRIHTGVETKFFAALAGAEDSFRHPTSESNGLSAYFTDEEFYAEMRRLFRKAISALPEPASTATHFLEKTPHHDWHAEFILRTFPEARFIRLVRDGRAVAASMLRSADTWGGAWAPRAPSDAALLWARHVEADQRLDRLAPGRVTHVRYEDLRADARQPLRRILADLSFEADETFLARALSHTLTQTKSASDPFRSIGRPRHSSARTFPTEFFGSGAADARQSGLSRVRRVLVECLVGDLLISEGYDGGRSLASLAPAVRRSRLLRRILRRLPL